MTLPPRWESRLLVLPSSSLVDSHPLLLGGRELHQVAAALLGTPVCLVMLLLVLQPSLAPKMVEVRQHVLRAIRAAIVVQVCLHVLPVIIMPGVLLHVLPVGTAVIMTGVCHPEGPPVIPAHVLISTSQGLCPHIPLEVKHPTCSVPSHVFLTIIVVGPPPHVVHIRRELVCHHHVGEHTSILVLHLNPEPVIKAPV